MVNVVSGMLPQNNGTASQMILTCRYYRKVQDIFDLEVIYCIVLCFSGIIYGRIFNAVSEFFYIWKLDIQVCNFVIC